MGMGDWLGAGAVELLGSKRGLEPLQQVVCNAFLLEFDEVKDPGRENDLQTIVGKIWVFNRTSDPANLEKSSAYFIIIVKRY
jgi:hypothetical protein